MNVFPNLTFVNASAKAKKKKASLARGTQENLEYSEISS
jgi:hypothetical protein